MSKKTTTTTNQTAGGSELPNSMSLKQQIQVLRAFVGPAQLSAMFQGLAGEENIYFRDKFSMMTEIIKNMPKTYEQEAMGDSAIVSLHYFTAGADWYITEKDVETADAPGQHQAFGMADIGHGGELGYISIVELLRNGAELDLHFAPRTLASIKR